jgi:hypothetical protein
MIFSSIVSSPFPSSLKDWGGYDAFVNFSRF